MNITLLKLNNEEWVLKEINGTKYLHNFRQGDSYIIPKEVWPRLENFLMSVNDYDISQPPSEAKALINTGILAPCPKEIGQTKMIRYDGHRINKVHFHITSQCNLNCKHCYIMDNNWDDLKTEDILSAINQLGEMGLFSITLTGGEPLIKEDIGNILNSIEDNAIHLDDFFTNGTLINKRIDVINKIADTFDTMFYVSVDGLKESHNSFRGSLFEHTIEGIKTLKNLGCKVAINTTLTKDNHNEILDVYKLAINLDADMFRIIVPFELGHWKNICSDMKVSFEIEMDTYLRLMRQWQDDGKPFKLEMGHIFRYLKKSVSTYSFESEVCDCVHGYAVIWPNGDVSHCPLLPKYSKVGNIRNAPLTKIWESPKMREFKEMTVRDVIKKECLSCSYLKYCGTGCRANSKLVGLKYTDTDPIICRIYKEGYADKFLEME